MPEDGFRQLERMRNLDQKMEDAHARAFKITSKQERRAATRVFVLSLIVLALLIGLLTGFLSGGLVAG